MLALPAQPTYLERLDKSQHFEFGTQEDLGVLAACESFVDDPDHALAHAVPQVLDVLLGPEAVGSLENVRFDQEEANNLLEQG